VLAEQVFVDADQQGLVVRDGAVEVEKDCACGPHALLRYHGVGCGLAVGRLWFGS
jgi:hypothetical protein